MQESKGLAVGGLVLGIASIVFAFIYTWIGLALGIVGIVLSAMAMKRCPSAKGLAIGGLVCDRRARIRPRIHLVASGTGRICVGKCPCLPRPKRPSSAS